METGLVYAARLAIPLEAERRVFLWRLLLVFIARYIVANKQVK